MCYRRFLRLLLGSIFSIGCQYSCIAALLCTSTLPGSSPRPPSAWTTAMTLRRRRLENTATTKSKMTNLGYCCWHVCLALHGDIAHSSSINMTLSYFALATRCAVAHQCCPLIGAPSVCAVAEHWQYLFSGLPRLSCFHGGCIRLRAGAPLAKLLFPLHLI